MTTPSVVAAVQATAAFQRLEAALEAVRRNPSAATIQALKVARAEYNALVGLPVEGGGKPVAPGITRRIVPVVAGLLVCLLSLQACAVHKWAPPPAGPHLTFDQQVAQCRLFSRGVTPQGPGFVAASGSPAFVGGLVGGVLLASAIGTAVATQANFNDCMAASGWVVAD